MSPQKKTKKTSKPKPKSKQDKISQPISYQQFEKLIENLPDIAFDVQSNQRENDVGPQKTLDECALWYYNAFYRDATVRERYPFKLRACPQKIRDKLLTMPGKAKSSEDVSPKECADESPKECADESPKECADASPKECADESPKECADESPKECADESPKECADGGVKVGVDKQTFPELIIPSPDLKRPRSPKVVTERAVPPVRFGFFKKYMKNLDAISDKMRSCDEYKHLSKKECAREYFLQFYSSRDMRERFPIILKPCPGVVREKLLSPPNCLLPDVIAESPSEPKELYSSGQPIPKTKDQSPSLARSSKKVKKAPEQIRTAPIVAVPEPRILKDRKVAERCVEPAVQSENIPPKNLIVTSSQPTSLSSANQYDVIVNWESSTCSFQYPVSFELFTRCINYDELIVTLLRQSITNKSRLSVLIAKPKHHQCKQVFNLFYHSFYVYPRTRRQHKYRFECGGDKELLKKLCEHAKPLTESAKQKMEKTSMRQGLQAPNKADSQNKDLCIIVDDMEYKFPVTFSTFLMCINYDELKVHVVNEFTENEQRRAEILQEQDTCSRLIRSYYLSFYTSKKFREKFNYNFNRATPELRAKCLEFAPIATDLTRTRESADLERLYAARVAEVESKQRINVVHYESHDLTAHLARMSIMKKNKDLNEAVAISRKESDTASQLRKTTAPNRAEPAQCPTGTTTAQATASSTAEKIHSEESALTLSNPISFEQMMGVFEAPNIQKHNIKYLIYGSQGLRRTIWRILFQLSQEEFRTYTSFYNGEALYDNESFLQQCHHLVVDQGHWPLNLYVKLTMLRYLLHIKGVELQSLELSQLSPMILHWRDLMLHTDFDGIVTQNYTDRTGRKIDDNEFLSHEREELYARCWTHDQWIHQVPQITNPAINEAVIADAPALAEVKLKPLCGVQSQDTDITIESVSITSSPSVTVVTICPPTEPNAQSTSFVDMDEVDPASQIPNTQNDPLMESMRVQVKQEPITFLDKMRGSCLNSEDFLWESINTEDQIIKLDDSQKSLSNLACFAIHTVPTAVPPLNAVTTPQFPESDEEIAETPPVPPVVEVKQEEELDTLPAAIHTELDAAALPLHEPTKRKNIMPVANPGCIKKPRLIKETVPQLRHEFRALPLHAVVRIELPDFDFGSENEQPTTSSAQVTEQPSTSSAQVAEQPSTSSAQVTEQPSTSSAQVAEQPSTSSAQVTEQPSTSSAQVAEQPSTSSAQVAEQPSTSSAQVADHATEITVTPSQDFASGNSLLASSQLDALLDAPNVTHRKVNTDNVAGRDTDNIIDKGPPPVLQCCIIFRCVERYRCFTALKKEEIMKYMIEGHIEGSLYQDALIKINGKLCNLRGPLIETIFPHMSARLRCDFLKILRDLGSYVYNSRRNTYKDCTEDIRVRVLSIFIDVAPKFVYFCAQFENATREWATCRTMDRWDPNNVRRSPKCDVAAAIKPGILQRMKQIKKQIC
ncbi:protein telomere ends associated-like [Drosophila obscura]|uniref:protein telomere ends associated-like n=1 Tax=Drosophila obscura TaxID=7282 RepID=UPI001BB24483|nr:protein telomere ends associated-like [Drosophila obscura]